MLAVSPGPCHNSFVLLPYNPGAVTLIFVVVGLFFSLLAAFSPA